MTRRQFAVTVTDEGSERLQAKLAAAERDLRTLSLHMGEVCAERDAAHQAHAVELERENARLQAELAAAESALAESKAECLDVYEKLAASSALAAQYIVAKVGFEAALAETRLVLADANKLNKILLDMRSASEAALSALPSAPSEAERGNNGA